MGTFPRMRVLIFLLITIKNGSADKECDTPDTPNTPDTPDRRDAMSSSELREENQFLMEKMRYLGFDCAMNILKLDLELIWPLTYEGLYYPFYRNFTARVLTPSMVSELQKISLSFLHVRNHQTAFLMNLEDPGKKLFSYCRHMHAALTRNSLPNIPNILPVRSVLIARFLITFVDRYKDKDDTLEEALEKFSIQSSRLKVIAIGYHHLFSLEIAKNPGVSLPQILAEMRLTDAWNFTIEDIEFINNLHAEFDELEKILIKTVSVAKPERGELTYVTTRPRPEILSNGYRVIIQDQYLGVGVEVTGISPTVNIRHCPGFKKDHLV